MSTTPAPPGPAGDDPTSIASWVKIGGLLVLVVTIIAVTQANRGGGGKPRPPAAASPPGSHVGSLLADAGRGRHGHVPHRLRRHRTGHVDRPDPARPSEVAMQRRLGTWNTPTATTTTALPIRPRQPSRGRATRCRGAPRSGRVQLVCRHLHPVRSVLSAVGGNQLRVGVPFGFDTLAADRAPTEIDPYFGVVGGTALPGLLPAGGLLAGLRHDCPGPDRDRRHAHRCPDEELQQCGRRRGRW